jgi:nucleoside-diphosphate-sugar epimerase
MPATGATERAQLLLDAETVLRTATGACRRWFVLRLAGIYGPGRHALLDQVRSGEIAGSGEHHLNLIHRDDVASAVAASFMAPAALAGEIFNIVDDGRATKAEIVTWLAEQLGVTPPRFSGEHAGRRRAMTPDRVILNAKAKRALAWQPRYPTFREGYANLLSR